MTGTFTTGLQVSARSQFFNCHRRMLFDDLTLSLLLIYNFDKLANLLFFKFSPQADMYCK